MKTASAEVIPATPGTPFAGGTFLGRIFVGAEAFAVVAAPRAGGELDRALWNDSEAFVAGATSVYDGLANTRAMAEAGSALAKWALDLRIEGFDDWYLPSRGEALLAYGAAIEGEEAFSNEEAYWTSNQFTPAGIAESAWSQDFSGGYQDDWRKGDETRARAVRRVKIT